MAALGLAVSNLDVSLQGARRADQLALRNVSFEIARGKAYGLVGESGSGKSTAALAIVRYLPRNGRVSGSPISVGSRGRSWRLNPRAGFATCAPEAISMVYQEPGRAPEPIHPDRPAAHRGPKKDKRLLPNEAGLTAARGPCFRYGPASLIRGA